MATGYCRWREIMWNPVQFHSWSFIFQILWIGNSNSDREFTILEDCAPRPMWCWSPSSARSRSWRIISSSASLFGAMQTCRKVKRGKTNASQYQVSTILKSYLWNWNWFCCVWNNVYLDPQMLGCWKLFILGWTSLPKDPREWNPQCYCGPFTQPITAPHWAKFHSLKDETSINDCAILQPNEISREPSYCWLVVSNILYFL